MDSASAVPPPGGVLRRMVRSLWWHRNSLAIGTAPPPVTPQPAEAPPAPITASDATTKVGQSRRHVRMQAMYPPRRPDFLEEAATAREMRRL